MKAAPARETSPECGLKEHGLCRSFKATMVGAAVAIPRRCYCTCHGPKRG